MSGAGNVVKVSISLPSELLSFLDRAAKVGRTSRSGLIARLLRDRAQQEEREQMIEGYRAMAEQNRRLAEEHLPAASEVWAKYDQAR